MGYNKSPKSVKRVKTYLDVLVAANGSSVTFDSPRPTTLMYALHEGLFAAEFLKYPVYSHLRALYEIVKKPGAIVCQPKTLQVLSSGAITLPEPTSWMDAVEAIFKYKEATIPIILPNLILGGEVDNEAFRVWCEGNDFQLITLPQGYKVINNGNKNAASDSLHDDIPAKRASSNGFDGDDHVHDLS